MAQDEQELALLYHMAAIPQARIEPRPENQNLECNDDDDEVQIVYEIRGQADVDPDRERPVARIPPGMDAQQGPAHPVPEAIPLRRIIDEMRGFEALDHPNDEDEGYASGDDDVRRRGPLERRIRDLEPFLLNQPPLIPFDFEMHEFLEPPRDRVHPEEPVLVEDDQIGNDRPPFLIEINLGQIGNPLPRRLDVLERAPAPGLYEAIEPFRILFVPQGPNAAALIEALHHGFFRMEPQQGEMRMGHVHGTVALSPDRNIWRCHRCIIEQPGDFNRYLGWQIFDEHVLGLTRVLPHIYCECGRVAFFFEDMDRCRICLGMLDAHWPEIQGGVRLRATLAQAAIFWNH
ncbi:hypothetical protein QAD02_003239 [Eretmocerus hayati]|uniref:Uncharacterized protein n=1 Tax=Eretmocerus hayati TaxID=131215 RepID=A0ACC2NL45_9HYME|nr:hypothetical protein QAD02_003239 [Eretmocerus hayati]